MATRIVTELHDDIDGSNASRLSGLHWPASSMRLTYAIATPTGYATALQSSSGMPAR
jgi:hypothetical protein